MKVLENEDNEDESFEEENVNEKDESGKPTVKIENIVATVILDTALDLNLIETRIPDVDYNPDQFPGLVYRLQNPKITALIFKSGKMVVTGAKSVKQLVWAVKTILKKLMIKGVPMQGKPQIQIQNIVASANLNVVVDLEKAAFTLPKSMYEPEQFPGLIYRMEKPRVVLLIFSSGKMVITGAKRESEVEDAVNGIYDILKSNKCIKEEGSL